MAPPKVSNYPRVSSTGDWSVAHKSITCVSVCRNRRSHFRLPGPGRFNRKSHTNANIIKLLTSGGAFTPRHVGICPPQLSLTCFVSWKWKLRDVNWYGMNVLQIRHRVEDVRFTEALLLSSQDDCIVMNSKFLAFNRFLYIWAPNNKINSCSTY